jgi:hypothetical protein
MAARVKEAAVHLSRRADDASLGVELLRDIRDIRDVMVAAGNYRIRSEALAQQLSDMKDRPWAEMPFSGKPITQTQLAKLLKGYQVRPKDMKFGETTYKGYEFAWFNTAFRYIPLTPPENTRNPATLADSCEKRGNQASGQVAAKLADSGQSCPVAPRLGGPAPHHDNDPFASLRGPAQLSRGKRP